MIKSARSKIVCPHRLAAQDKALSRLKLGFEVPMGAQFPRNRQQILLSGFCLF